MRKFVILISICSCLLSFGQSKINLFLKPSDTLNKSRRNTLVISQSSLAALTLVGLDQLWYADYERSKFRTTNDNSQWLQMDKLGHDYASYQLGQLGAESLNWAGVSEKDQLIYGGCLVFSFLTAIEIFDDFSKEWGFSWRDM